MNFFGFFLFPGVMNLKLKLRKSKKNKKMLDEKENLLKKNER